MALITEAMLRKQFTVQELCEMQEYLAAEDLIITPAAREFLAGYKVKILQSKKTRAKTLQTKNTRSEVEKSALPAFSEPNFYTDEHGMKYSKKPEHMTTLRGETLVLKTAPIIKLRGMIDSFEAQILQVQAELQATKEKSIVLELEEVLGFVRTLLACEVKQIPVPSTKLLGLNFDEIREKSHYPKKYFGIEHFTPSYTNGALVVQLNALRTAAREVELCACAAFVSTDGLPTQMDIIEGLNRLSSLFYVMMLREVAKGHK